MELLALPDVLLTITKKESSFQTIVPWDGDNLLLQVTEEPFKRHKDLLYEIIKALSTSTTTLLHTPGEPLTVVTLTSEITDPSIF
ncbi:Uncharacterised protein [Chlamydia trachomatis]|nr:Uncharacterised protein [Chlamydia trachomatis]